MKTILTMVAVLLLTGCIGLSPNYQNEYTDGTADATTATDDYLVQKYSTLKNGSNYSEKNATLNELKRRYKFYDWDNLLKGKITTGMSEREVQFAWGKPKSINRASYGSQWVYGRIRYGTQQYVYFNTGGSVTGWN